MKNKKHHHIETRDLFAVLIASSMVLLIFANLKLMTKNRILRYEIYKSQIEEIKDNTEKNDEKCSLIPNPGNCEAQIPSYFYNSENENCEEFVWRGCEGVRPFETVEDCQITCIKDIHN